MQVGITLLIGAASHGIVDVKENKYISTLLALSTPALNGVNFPKVAQKGLALNKAGVKRGQ